MSLASAAGCSRERLLTPDQGSRATNALTRSGREFVLTLKRDGLSNFSSWEH